LAGLVAFAGMAVAARTDSRSTESCRPSNDEVAVFAADGQCAVLRAGTYRTTVEAGLGNKPIASVKAGRFARVAVCGLDDRFEVRCEDSTAFVRSHPGSDRPWTFVQVARNPQALKCLPKDLEITISATSQAIGPCIRLTAGSYDTAEQIGLVRLPTLRFISEEREAVEALRRDGTLLVGGAELHIKVGARVQAKLCESEKFGGRCESVSPRWSTRFHVGSTRVMAYCRPTSNQVALFTEPQRFGYCTVRNIGEYPTAALLQVEGRPSASIRLGSGVEVRACSEENFSGECIEAKGGATIDGVKKSLLIRPRKEAATP